MMRWLAVVYILVVLVLSAKARATQTSIAFGFIDHQAIITR